MSSDLLKNFFTHKILFEKKPKRFKFPVPEKPSLKMNLNRRIRRRISV
jgi:hypothetical protein